MALRKSLMNLLYARGYGVAGHVVLCCVTLLFLLLLPVANARPQVVAIGGVSSDGDEEFPIPDSCQDFDVQMCEEFAATGECERNPAFMEAACQRTCGTCKPNSRVSGCVDTREECVGWGASGECDINPAFMNVNCPATCNTCPPAGPEDCVDQHQFCFLGSLLGLCRTNPSFYLIFCSDSCRKFLDVCRQGRSSTVRDLCSAQSRGQDIDCGVDPTQGVIERSSGAHTPLWRRGGRALHETREETGSFYGVQETRNNTSETYGHDRRAMDSTRRGRDDVSLMELLVGTGRELLDCVSKTLFNSEWESLGSEGQNVIGQDEDSCPFTRRSKTPRDVAEEEHILPDDEDLVNGETGHPDILDFEEEEDPPHQIPLEYEEEMRQFDGELPDENNTTTTDNITSICEVSLTETVSVDVCSFVTGIAIAILVYELIIDPENPPGQAITPVPPMIPMFPTLPTVLSTPPTPAPSSPSPSPTPSSNPTPTPQMSVTSVATPDPIVEARVRAFVPYCTGAGYLSLVERLKRLVNRNTGRPLNPVAASLAVAVNFCKEGVGSREDILTSVPAAPPSFQVPSIEDILRDDDEAKISLTAPDRWPGISHPALYLYQGGNVPPPPPPPPPSPTNVTIVTTVTLGGVVVSNGTQVVPGDGIPPEGTAPAGGSDGAPPAGGDGDVAASDGAAAGDDGGGAAGDDGGAGVDGAKRGPRPVTAETLGNRNAFSCGGALISPYHVLTAAHCLIERGITQTPRVAFSKPSVVRLGEVDFERADESQAFDYEVEGIQVHENYVLPAKYSDIAIITLKDKVEFTSALRPFCLPRQQRDLVGRLCTVSGWGRTRDGPLSTVLHNLEVEVVSNQECNTVYSTSEGTRPYFEIQYPQGINDLILCAGKINDVCRGDSGGPLVLEEDGILQDVGVVSTGYGCGGVLFPGIYTRVDQFTSWVDDEIYGGCSLLV
ncbi:uncharacterized protein [Panulirus ornatus]|uniref:uncharacterized protein n=1 Tax=Panulirus ornatus TaxID=150431 RepID=UPI003A8BE1EA